MKRKTGFTLIELLVVISIMSLLSSVVFSNLNDARQKARRAAGKQFSSSILHIVGDKLIGEWKLDECTGAIVNDTSGSGSSASIVNVVSPWPSSDTPMGTGCALVLNGLNQYVTGGQLPNVGAAADITISAWVKPALVSAGLRVVFSKGASGGCFNYGMSISGALLRARNSAGDYNLSGSVKVNEWQHLVVVFSAAGASGYINGSFVGSNPSAITSNCPFLGWVIGTTSNNLPGLYFSGAVDEVRVYGANLTSGAIKQLYAEGRSRHENLTYQNR